MRAVLPTRPAHRPPGAAAPRGHGPSGRGLGLETLEDRTVPSVSVLGVPLPDFRLPPLQSVPVAAEVHPPAELAQVLGERLAVSLLAPLPDFLRPAGTAAVATPATGSMTVTNFQVDNGGLTQLEGNFQMPD